MRKSLMILFVVLFILQYTTAQTTSSTFKRFGFIVGGNVSNMNFNKGIPPPPSPVASSWKAGITIGFLLHVPLITNLSIQSEYLFSQVLGEDKSMEIKYRFNYLSMPVLLSYQLSKKISIEAGPQVDLLIDAKRKIAGTSSKITYETEERNFGIDAGMEFKVMKSISLNARYSKGLNHIGIGRQISARKEFKLEQFLLTTSMRF